MARVAVACALAWLTLLPVDASADVDLGSLLAQPPAGDWVQATSSADRIQGPFTAADYAAYLKAADPNADAAGTEATLNADGFTGGFGHEWEEFTSRDYLVERVFAFRDDGGANSWYSDIKAGSQSNTNVTGDIPGVSAIPDSYGAVLKSKSSSVTQWRVYFVVHDLVFVVHADSSSNNLSTMAVGQAKRMYDAASSVFPSPSPTPQPSAAPQRHSAPFNPVAIAIIVTVALLLIAAAVGGTLLLLARRPRPAQPYPVRMSPDRVYWWDGVQWQPTATSTPPGAARSPDGTHWWDGASWRPVQPGPSAPFPASER